MQECPEAITSLKFLSRDSRFDVIASGSALGMSYKQASSFPVGYVDFYDMTALDFEEFLWALGIEPSVLLTLRSSFDSRTPVPKAIHEKMLDLLRRYTAVGGMPEVVASFAETGDYAAADRLQR